MDELSMSLRLLLLLRLPNTAPLIAQ